MQFTIRIAMKRWLACAALVALAVVAAPARDGRRPSGALSPSSAYAAFILGEIVDAAGTPEAPQIYRAPVDSARAVIVRGREAILYNPDFLDEVNERAGTDWAAVSVIAHEFGHHYYGHVHAGAEGLAPDVLRQRELEADYFSGYVLARMGTSVEEAEAAQDTLYDEEWSDTHPDSRRRLRAIVAGWVDGREGGPLAGDPIERLHATPRRALNALAYGFAAPDDHAAEPLPPGRW